MVNPESYGHWFGKGEGFAGKCKEQTPDFKLSPVILRNVHDIHI